MVADLYRAFAFIWHVAIGAGNAAAGMNALIPQFKLGMLRLKSGAVSVGMNPILKACIIIIFFCLLGS